METLKSMAGGSNSGQDASTNAGNDTNTDGLSTDGDMPSREEMLATIKSLQNANNAQSKTTSKAMAITDSKQREKMLKEAFDTEMEANGHSKMAKRMQSGTWQGLGFGGGIGAATGLGLGTGLGVLLGAITAVPTTGIGMLVGSGVGAFHGPWVKLGGKEVKFEEADPEQIVDALEEEREKQARTRIEERAPSPPKDSTPVARLDATPRRKPRKLEIRSQPVSSTKKTSNEGINEDSNSRQQLTNPPSRSKPKLETGPEQTARTEHALDKSIAEKSKPRSKPKKLEIRSRQNAPT